MADINIKKKLLAIDRRTFLKGAGNIMIALPFLDYLFDLPPAEAAQIPLRYIVVSNGISLGVPSRTFEGASKFNPVNIGPNWTPSPALININNYPMLKPYITVITNLGIPYGTNIMNNGPRFGPDSDFHGELGCDRVQMTGLSAGLKGPSSDQLLKANLGLGNNFIHMNYLVQPRSYLGGITQNAMSQFNTNGTSITPQVDPAQAFTSLVSGINTGDIQAETERIQALKARKNIVDLLEPRRVEYLKKVLNSSSKSRLSDHFDQLRDLSVQIDTDIMAAANTSQSCKISTKPPAVPTGSDYVGSLTTSEFNSTTGWSDELTRSRLLREIAVMGISCDRVRIGTLRLTFNHSWINARQLVPGLTAKARDYHEISHGGGTIDDLAKCTAWHTHEFFKLAEALRGIPEGPGNILDNTVIIFKSEGGYGYLADKVTIGAHSGDNMAILLAGKAGGIKGGHYKANKEHPCEVILTAMKAAGYTGSSFGSVTKEFPGIR